MEAKMSEKISRLLLGVHCINKCKFLIEDLQRHIADECVVGGVLAQDLHFQTFVFQLRAIHELLNDMSENFENIIEHDLIPKESVG